MAIKAGLLLVLLSGIIINFINGQVSFTVTNEEGPGTRPDPIPDRQEGNIGRHFFTKIGGRVDITATFDVQGTPDEEIKVRWFYNGEEIMFSPNPGGVGTPPAGTNRFSIRESTSVFTDKFVYEDTNIPVGSSTLYIDDIDGRHPGNYTFEVYSGNARASASSQLFLGTPPTLIPTPPGVTDPPGPNQGNLDFASGGGTLSCDQEFVYYATFSGDPAPVVTCTDSRNAGTQEPQTNNDPLQTTVKYTLGPFPPSAVVTVTCIASNDHGTVIRSEDVSSLGEPPVLTSNIPPRLECTSASASVSVRVNERACGLEGTGVITIVHALQREGSVAEIKWFHVDNNGVTREVTEGGRFTIRREALNQLLQIVQPEQSDEGQYYITATNCAGEVSSILVNTDLDVFVRPIIDFNQPAIPAPGSCQDDSGFTTVNVKDADRNDLAGDPAVCITCPASGDPPATYTWTRDGVAVTSTNPYLDVSGLISSDRATCFTCVATNLAGNDISEVCLQAAPNVEYRLENRGCTKTCGGGVIDFQLVCVEIGEGAVATPVDESVCIQQQVPRPQIPTEICNNLPCPPQFILGAWTPCSSSCEQGTRTRTVRCRQIDANGIQRFVAVSVCIGSGLTAPGNTEQCNAISRVRRTGDLNPCPVPENFMFETSEWSACTETCHRGRRTRTVRCREIDRETNRFGRVYPDRVCVDLGHPKPADIERCATGPCRNYGIWRCGGWSDCSSSCGPGGQVRMISCYDPLTKSESDNCYPYYRPTSFRICNQGPCLQSPECRDSPYYHCYVLRDAPLYCNDNRYVGVCCKTCEDIIFRPVTTTTPTTTTPATTTTPEPATTTEGVSTLPA